MSVQPPFARDETPDREGLSPGYGGVQAPPAAPSPPPGNLPVAPPPQSESGGGMAATGLVFGIITLVLPVVGAVLLRMRFPGLGGLSILATVPAGIIGVVLSALGLGSLLRRRSAIAGLILSVLGLIFGLAVLAGGLAALYAFRVHGGLPPIRHPLRPLRP